MRLLIFFWTFFLLTTGQAHVWDRKQKKKNFVQQFIFMLRVISLFFFGKGEKKLKDKSALMNFKRIPIDSG